MMKRVLSSVAFICVTLAAMPANAGMYTYSKIEYPSSALSALTTDVNRSGQFAVNLILQNTSPYIWSASGQKVQLQTAGGFGYQSEVLALNNRGMAVGVSTDLYSDNFKSRATVWHGATASLLPGLGGNIEAAWDINDTGSIVGYSRASYSGPAHALLWDTSGVHDLGTGGGISAGATGINNTGTIIGVTSFEGGVQNGTLWKHGTITHIGTLGGKRSVLADVNDSGWAVGDSLLEGDRDWRAILWDGDDLRDLGTLGGRWSTANNIGQDGTVFGSASTVGEKQHAAIWRNGSAIDLHDLVQNRADLGALTMANAIGSDSNGAIYGYLFDRETYWGGTFVLTPTKDAEVPEPASLSFTLAGIAFLLFRRKSGPV